jgi:hypothetical protein
LRAGFLANFALMPNTEDQPELKAPPEPVAPPPPAAAIARELGGRDGLEPTRYGDWELRGRCIDF